MNALIKKLGHVVALSTEDRDVLEAMCDTRRTVARYRDIVREGDCPDHVHVLLDGWAARYKGLANGSRQITALLIPGDICDMESTVLHRMDHSVTALTKVTVASVPRERLVEVTRIRPVLAQAFWWTAMVDAAVARAWIVNIGRRSARARVAHLACELHHRMAANGLVTDGEIKLPLTQNDLGDALGLTSVHVNRSLKGLRDEGLMELQSRTLTILDGSRLGRVAGFDSGYLHR